MSGWQPRRAWRKGIQEPVVGGRESLVRVAGGPTDPAHLLPGGGSCPGDAVRGAMVTLTVVVAYRGFIQAPRTNRVRSGWGESYLIARGCQRVIEGHRAVNRVSAECPVPEQVTTTGRTSRGPVKGTGGPGVRLVCTRYRFLNRHTHHALAPVVGT